MSSIGPNETGKYYNRVQAQGIYLHLIIANISFLIEVFITCKVKTIHTKENMQNTKNVR